jgi:hypothetical protein
MMATKKKTGEKVETVTLTPESVRSELVYLDNNGVVSFTPEGVFDTNSSIDGEVFADEYQFVRRVRIVDERDA